MMLLLIEWVESIAGNPIFVDANDIDAEAQANTLSFGITAKDALGLTEEDLLDFIRAVKVMRSGQILERSGHSRPMVLYCWLDEQTAELNIGLVSASHGQLPFGSFTKPADLATIVKSFLTSPYHDGISMEEFHEATGADERPPYVLGVWSTTLPVSGDPTGS